MTRKVTVKICTPLPVPVSELPTIGRLASQAANTHGIDERKIYMTQEGNDLVISFELEIK